MSKTWRDHCSPIIAEVIDEVGTEDMKKLRKALREAYPYGERKYWPYKVWCDEVNRQLKRAKYGIKEVQMPLFDEKECNNEKGSD